MIFSSADGNCVSGTLPFGNHCFGDYGTTINLLRVTDNPWFEGSPLGQYPPLNLIIFRFFSDLEQYVGNNFTLSFYLLTILLSGLFPLWSASRASKSDQRRKYILFLGLLSLPLLAAIDRGNNAVWAIPSFYLAVSNFLRGETNKSIIFLSVAIAFRPQLVFFLLLFLLTKKYIALIKICALTGLIYVLSFTIYLLNFDLKTMINYIQATKNYGSGIPGTWPPNLSLARGMKVFLEWFSVELQDSILILSSSLLIISTLVCVFFLKDPYRLRNAVFLLTPIVFLSAPMTWYYYGSFLVVVVALLVKERVKMNELFQSQNQTYTYLGGIVITNSILFLPILEDNNNLIQYLVPVYWMMFYISFISQSIFSFVKIGLAHNEAH